MSNIVKLPYAHTNTESGFQWNTLNMPHPAQPSSSFLRQALARCEKYRTQPGNFGLY